MWLASARRRLPLLAPAALLAAALGCAHAEPSTFAPAAPAPKATAPPQKIVQVEAPVQPEAAPAADGRAELDAALGRLRDGSVYFEFDRSALSADAQTKLAAAGDVLRSHPALAVQVEGNCDERGSEEYNLALGQRRAEAARKYLIRMGAVPAQVTAISYGAEKARDPGHDEAAWAQNRRDDVVPR